MDGESSQRPDGTTYEKSGKKKRRKKRKAEKLDDAVVSGHLLCF